MNRTVLAWFLAFVLNSCNVEEVPPTPSQESKTTAPKDTGTTVSYPLFPPPTKEKIRSVEFLLDGFFSCRKDRCGNQKYEADVAEKDPEGHLTGLLDAFGSRLFLCPEPDDSTCPAEEAAGRYLRYLDTLDDESAVETIRTHLLFSRHACGDSNDNFYLPGCVELEDRLEDKLAERSDDKAFLTLAEYYRKNGDVVSSRHIAKWLERKKDSIYQTLSALLTEALEEKKRKGKEPTFCSFYQGRSTKSSEALHLLFEHDQQRLTTEIAAGVYGEAGIACFLGKVNTAYIDHYLLPGRITLNEVLLWRMYKQVKSPSLKLSILTFYIPYGHRVREELPEVYGEANPDEAEVLVSYLSRMSSESPRCYGNCPHDENYSLFKRLYEVAMTKEQKCAVVMRLNALWNENEEEREKWCGVGN